MSTETPSAGIQLGYRSLFSVRQSEEPDVVSMSTAQLYSWLRDKRYAVDALRENEVVDLAEGVTASLFRMEDRDGSVTLRARLREDGPAGVWESTLMVHAPGREVEDSSVLLEVRGPTRAGTPKLARLLTGALPARDSRALLRDRPEVVRADDVDELAHAVCDPNRRGLLFVAGMSSDLPFDKWREHVNQLLRHTPGLAASYFLDPGATAELARTMGATHAVAPGTIRTYLPDADPASELDALRHRVLGTDRIVRASTGRLANLLRQRALEDTLQAELPPKVRRLQRRIGEYIDEILLSGVRTERELRGPRDENVVASPPTTAAPPATEIERGPSKTLAEEVYRQLNELALRLLGVDRLTVDVAERIAELAVQGFRADTRLEQVGAQLARLRDEVDSARDDRAEAMSRLADEQLEHAATAEELESLGRRNAYLEGLIRRSGNVHELYVEVKHDTPPVPDDFEALLAMATDLDHIEMTGDPSFTLSLDTHDPLGRWAKKTWNVLLALADYGRTTHTGLCTTDVEGYLRNTPDGCGSYSANKHARTESEDVQNNARYREARVFPVPNEVEPNGRIEMLAHFKIAQSGLVSPRLHYYDDTSRTGKVYIGYIGPHLPTKRTN